jgi:hypothetical protein
MNNREVAHLWANQSRASGKGSNFFFEGPTIYSYGYHFPIARHVGSVILFTTDSYSSSTAKHKAYTRQAIADCEMVIDVPDVTAESPEEHARNLAAVVASHESALLKLARARTNGERIAADVERIAENARTYAHAFGLPVPALANASPDVLARVRERAAAERDNRNRQERERNDAKRGDWSERAARWRAGENVSTHGAGLPTDVPTLLRLIDGGKVIETSRGARVPVSVAPALAESIFSTRRDGKAWVVPSSFIAAGRAAVGDYTLREIRADGALVVGCHVLEFAEVSAMLERLGITEN